MCAPAEPSAAEAPPPPATAFHASEQEQAALAVIKASPALPAAGETKPKLNAILAQPEYAGGGAPQQSSLMQRFWDWLGRMFSRFGFGAPSWLALFVMAMVIVALTYLLVRVVWEWQARRSRRVAANAEPGEVVLGTEALLKAAMDAAARGDFRLAIRLRFKWLLSTLGLGESALLTNRQLTARLSREHPAVREPLKQLVACFEDAWYGMLPCSETELVRAAQLSESVRAQLGEAAP